MTLDTLADTERRELEQALNSEAERIRRWIDPRGGPAEPLRSRLQAALAVLEVAPREDRPAAALRGRALAALGRWPQALPLLDAAAAADVLWLAEEALGRGGSARALALLGGAGPGGAAAAIGALARTAEGDLAGARAGLERALQAEGGDALLLAVSAILAVQAGEYAAASERFDRVLAARPGAGWPLALRAMMHRSRGDFDACLRDLREAAAREPAAWIVRLCAESSEQAGLMEAAMEEARRLTEIVPADASAHALTGHLYFHRKLYPRAQAAFTEAMRLDPGDARLAWERAWARWLGGDAAGALEDASACVRLDPTDPSYRVAEQRLRIAAGDARQARATLLRWIRSGERDLEAGARALLATLQFRRGRYAAAERGFAAAERLVRSGASATTFGDVGYSNVARAIGYIKSKETPMTQEPQQQPQADGEAAPPVLILSGLGLHYPYQATLEVLNALTGADAIFSNLAGKEPMEFLSLFCDDVQTVSYEGMFDEGIWVEKIFQKVRPGRTVAFVTRGHPLVSGRLAFELLQRARAVGAQVRSYGALSTVDNILALSQEVLSETFHALQVFDSKAVLLGRVLLQPQAPAILYIGLPYGSPRSDSDAYLAELEAFLRRLYPPGFKALLYGPRYDSRELEPVALESLGARLSQVDVNMLTSMILFLPAHGGSWPASPVPARPRRTEDGRA